MKKIRFLIAGVLSCLFAVALCACTHSTLIKSISVTTPPAKTEYVEGENFDGTGMVVTAEYADGFTEVVTAYTVSPSGALSTSDTSVKISYTSGNVTVSTTQEITVLPAGASLERIEITAEPATKVYYEGDVFDPSGMEITAYFDDDSAVKVENYSYTPDGALTVNDNLITISYTAGGVTETAFQEISVQVKTMIGIRIATQPSKTDYVDGESFDVTGMVVEAAYNDASSVVLNDYSVDKQVLSLGDTSVTVSSGGFETTVNVNVAKSALQSIEAIYNGGQNIFMPGEVIDKSLFVVTATHGTGSLEKVYGVTDYDFSPEKIDEDTQEIVVTYRDGDISKSASLPIIVKFPSELEFSGTAVKQKSGYPFDAEGLTFTLKYTTGESERVDIERITFGDIRTGIVTVTAEYLDFYCDIPVTVEAVETKSVASDVATYVQSGDPAKLSELLINATNIRRSYLSFSYLVSAQDIDRAILQLTVMGFETKEQERPFRDYYRTLTLYAVPYDGVTSSMKWSEQPAFGEKIAVIKAPPIVDYVVEVDITDYIKQNIATLGGNFAFAIVNETDTTTDKSSFWFYDNSGTNAPALLFTKDLEADFVSVPEALTVNVGATLSLGASVQPFYASNDALTYESDNGSVASVSENGTVRGVSEGTARITVTSVNGKQATVTVTVNAAVAAGSYTYLSDSSAYVQMYDKNNITVRDTILKTQISCQSTSSITSLGNERRAFISIDFSALLGVGEVKSAIVSLYLGEAATHNSFKGDRHVDVDVVDNIDIDSVTYWNQQYTSDEYIGTVTVADGAAAGTEYTIDLTDYINAHIGELNGVITIMLCNRTEYNDATGGAFANFYSSRAAEAYRPKLTIEV